MKRPRAALYARVSTAQQDPRAQVADLRELGRARGWAVTLYVDRGVSGSRDRRPELDRLMADVHAGRVDVVACWKFDRFARSVRHLVTALEEFRARGVAFVSVRDAIDTSTPTGRLMFSIVASFAEFERDLIRERTVSGLAAARRRGRRLGRPRAQIDLSRALELRGQRQTLRQIAGELGCSRATLHRELEAHERKRKR